MRTVTPGNLTEPREFHIRRVVNADARYPGKFIPERMLEVLQSPAERRAIFKALALIATPGVMLTLGTTSQATALAFLCNRLELQLGTIPELLEPAGRLKIARFWVYRMDESAIRRQLDRA